MFERFTEKARRVIFFARYEASQFGSERIETEHLLLGLLREAPEIAERYFGRTEPHVAVLEQVREERQIPSEILEAERRIQYLAKQMQGAIANQEFEKARAYFEAERQARAELSKLREKHRLGDEKEMGWNSTAAAIRREIESRMPRKPMLATSQDLPLSHESRRALAYAAEEAERLRHAHIDAEHLLLGLMREEDSLAAQFLRERGLKLELLRAEVARRAVPPAGGAVFGGRARSSPGIPMPPMPRGFAGAWMSAMQDAGRILMLARHEASERNSGCIETSDLLRALASEKEFEDRFPGPAESVRKHPRPAPEARREKVSAAELPFSEECKRVFTLAAQEAARLGQRTGPGHLLLGILGVESCSAAEVLRDCGWTADRVRATLAPPPPPSDPEQGRSYV